MTIQIQKNSEMTTIDGHTLPDTNIEVFLDLKKNECLLWKGMIAQGSQTINN